MYQIEITHNFETAHRLSAPDAPIKCQSIHGHSWWVTVTLEGPTLDDSGMLVEFGAFKRAWRGFLDDHVDHHLLTHRDDPVAAAILAVQPDARLLRLPFQPTTEALAAWLAEQAERALRPIDPAGLARVASIHLQETRVNAARFLPHRPTP
jgi:6-pyruvoyltetrahydropterin/6-carboxytetrahydropterin synthase